MDARQLVSRYRQHPERVRLAKILLASERQVSQIVEAREILGLRIREPPAVERNPLLDPFDEPTEAVELELSKPFARESLEVGLEDHSTSISPRDAIVTP
jgi:hypothetical protein